MINIIGLGPGDIEFLTEKGRATIEKSEMVIGNQRHIDSVLPISSSGENIVINKISEINEILMKELIEVKKSLSTKEKKDKVISVVVSGDTGFYSLLDYIMRNLPEEFHKYIEVIPGISSFQYLFGKLKKCWHDYLLVSVHGRENDYISYLNFSKKGIVLLTDKTNNWKSISKNLVENNLKDIIVTVGANLSYSDENIFCFNLEDYEKCDFSTESPAVIIIEKRGGNNAHI
ncbi:MAG: precorrin-6y C5,15-methyltransferase (decarboxylating) subunit CbiE [Fusobacteriaceae bacterium]